MPEIRPATSSDIAQISDVLIRSISELCREDHQGDADLISEWTDNKSHDDIRRWLDGPHHMRVSTDETGKVCAVGTYSQQGQILLLYVDPTQRGKGHSHALLTAMELAIRRNGMRHATLDSTKTAYDFYKHRGWQDDATCQSGPSRPMCKELTTL